MRNMRQPQMAAIDFIIQSAAIIEGVERDHVFRRIRALKPQTDTIAALKKLLGTQTKEAGGAKHPSIAKNRAIIDYIPAGRKKGWNPIQSS